VQDSGFDGGHSKNSRSLQVKSNFGVQMYLFSDNVKRMNHEREENTEKERELQMEIEFTSLVENRVAPGKVYSPGSCKTQVGTSARRSRSMEKQVEYKK